MEQRSIIACLRLSFFRRPRWSNPGLKHCHCFDCVAGRGVPFLCKEHRYAHVTKPNQKTRGAGCLRASLMILKYVFVECVCASGATHTVCQPCENLGPQTKTKGSSCANENSAWKKTWKYRRIPTSRMIKKTHGESLRLARFDWSFRMAWEREIVQDKTNCNQLSSLLLRRFE